MCGTVSHDKDRGRSRTLGAEDWGWSITGQVLEVLDGRTIEMFGDAMCGLYYAQGDEERMFLDLASESRSMVSPGLASKSVSMISPGLP
jgi:hypothetical protein